MSVLPLATCRIRAIERRLRGDQQPGELIEPRISVAGLVHLEQPIATSMETDDMRLLEVHHRACFESLS